MSSLCRVLKSGQYEMTQGYSNSHRGVDIVGAGYTLDNIVAHSDGEIVEIEKNCNYNTYPNGASIYGNYVRIKHSNGYYTLYGHLAYGTVNVSLGQKVSKGQVLGYMGNTGYSNGGHLHFEVRNQNNERINPTEYLNKDLSNPEPTPSKNYKIGDVVEINGVYVSSTSTERLNPAITKGTITRIVEARNPYLLDNGNIGWVNEDCIVSAKVEYLSNPSYTGYSIVDALKQINVDSSYSYRSQLASKNNISNYSGTAEQNTKMLEMLKKGMLISI